MQSDSEEAKLVFSKPVWTEMFNILSNSHSKIIYVFLIETKILVANSIYRFGFIFQNKNMCNKLNSNLLLFFNKRI